MKFFLTNHALERIQERFPLFCQNFPILKNWNRSQGVVVLYPTFINLMKECKENNSFLNNTNYMIYLYEQYGYDTEYKMFELLKEGIVFVLAKKRSDKQFKIVTIMPGMFVPKVVNKKFSDKKKKEIIQKEKVLMKHEIYSDSIKTFVDTPFDTKKHSNEEEIIQKLMSRNEYKKIDVEHYYLRYGDEILTFNF